MSYPLKYNDGTGYKQITPTKEEFDEHLADFMSHGIDNAGFHNSIYRGKFLGTSVLAEQYANIQNGKFTDMYIGDYWTINDTDYIIAAFNYYLRQGDAGVTVSHITLVPRVAFYSHVMNDTNITTGGYVGSKMYTEGLDVAKAKIKADFPGRVLKHKRYLSNAVADGLASAGAWVESEVELMNEVMVYGSVVNGNATYGLFNIGIEKSQLPLFKFRPDMISMRSHNIWLRDVCSASHFAFVNNTGIANSYNASIAYGVRPAFSIS